MPENETKKNESGTGLPLAFTISDAAKAIGISKRTVFREIRRRKLFPTKSLRLITKEELFRYLRDEVEASRDIPKRFPGLKKQTSMQPT